MSAIIVAKAIDFAFTLALTGIERSVIVDQVRAMEEGGATPDQVTDALAKMAAESEAAAKGKAGLP